MIKHNIYIYVIIYELVIGHLHFNNCKLLPLVNVGGIGRLRFLQVVVLLTPNGLCSNHRFTTNDSLRHCSKYLICQPWPTNIRIC